MSFFFKVLFIYFCERRREKEREGEKHLGTWPPTQACALTGNRTSDPLVCRPALSTLSHPRQGYICLLNEMVRYKTSFKESSSTFF